MAPCGAEISGQEVLDLTTRLGHRTFAAFKADANLSSTVRPPLRSTDLDAMHARIDPVVWLNLLICFVLCGREVYDRTLSVNQNVSQKVLN